jgi:hypothetical protein
MVSATMGKRRRTQVLLAITAVLGLHLAIIWALLASHGFKPRAESRPLEFVLIAPPSFRNDRMTTRVPYGAVPRRRAAPTSSPSSPASTQHAEGDAIHPPIDWIGELERSAKNSTSDDGSMRKRDFGFPHAPSTGTARRPEFGWDRAATHRRGKRMEICSSTCRIQYRARRLRQGDGRSDRSDLLDRHQERGDAQLRAPGEMS